MSIRRFVNGFLSTFAAIRYLFQRPKVVWYMIVPALLTVIVFTLLILFSLEYLSTWLETELPIVEDDSWVGVVVYYGAVILLAAVLIMSSGYAFLSATKIIAAPFNDLLSERIEKEYNPTYSEPDDPVAHLIKWLLPSIWEEIKKVTLIIGGFVVLNLLNLLPGAQLIATPLLIAYSILVISVDFTDYAMARRLWSVKRKIAFVRTYLPEFIGFGTSVFLLILIPFMVLIVVQIAVIGGTLLFIDLTNRHPQPPTAI